jgi:hypothetical protein
MTVRDLILIGGGEDVMEEQWILYQDEVEVVCSLMTDTQLLVYKDMLEEMEKREVWKTENFPLSMIDLRMLIATMAWCFWLRKGKGVKIEKGEIVICELKESPFYKRYSDKKKRGEIDEGCEEDDGAGVEGRVDEDKAGEVGGRKGESEAIEGEESEWI